MRSARGGARGGRSASLPVMNLNLAAMIDVVFLLMMYFMLITEFRPPERAMGIELPARLGGAVSADPFALPSSPIDVVVRSSATPEGEPALLVLGGVASGARTVAALTASLGRARSEGLIDAEQRFVLRSEPGTRWQHTVRTLDALRGAGFERVAIEGDAGGRER